VKLHVVYADAAPSTSSNFLDNRLLAYGLFSLANSLMHLQLIYSSLAENCDMLLPHKQLAA
jgi:hypothetical protein